MADSGAAQHPNSHRPDGLVTAMPLRDGLLNPIPGDNPSGKTLRYDPVYDKIREARREEDVLPQGDWSREVKKSDYPLVIKLATEALSTKSKDLQLAAWLTEAIMSRDHVAGLQDGLDLLRGFMETFWDTLYPEIDDGDLEFRAAPLAWVGSKLDAAVRRLPLTKSKLDYFKNPGASAMRPTPPVRQKRPSAPQPSRKRNAPRKNSTRLFALPAMCTTKNWPPTFPPLSSRCSRLKPSATRSSDARPPALQTCAPLSKSCRTW
jgi:type VI secretion system ImpA family protein